MTAASWLQLAALIAFIVVGTRVLGPYLAGVFTVTDEPPAKRPFGDRVFGPVERLIYRLTGVDETREQRWNVYALSLLAFSLLSVLVLYAFQRLQGTLPFNPNGVGGVPAPLSFNTAVSFVTNTNWQNYSGESTMSHLTQMAGWRCRTSCRPPSASAWPSPSSAASCAAGAPPSATSGSTSCAAPSGCCSRWRSSSPSSSSARASSRTSTAPRRSRPWRDRRRRSPAARSPARRRSRSWARTAAATSTPTPPTRSRTRTASRTRSRSATLLLIPFALTYTFGRWAGDQKQGWVVLRRHVHPLDRWSAALAMGFEAHGNPELTARGADQSVTSTQTGGNMEGKEARFGAATCGLFAGATTGTSTGAVDVPARQLHAPRRHGPAGQHDARRGRPGRHRRRPLRHVDLRAAGACSSPA